MKARTSTGTLAAGLLALAVCFLLATSTTRFRRTTSSHRDTKRAPVRWGGAPPRAQQAADPQRGQPEAGLGGLAPGQPSLASFKRVQAIARAAGRSPDIDTRLVREFAAAPWLLPRRTPALRYAGVHDFDALLRVRSAPVDPYQRSIALLLFDRARAGFAQNTVYSMVKMGGVQNYMMLTWTASDLAACADLNLPCADVSRWLLKPTAEGKEAQLGTPDFNAVQWLKPPAMLRAAEQGHAVLMLDTDIAFTVKPVWASLLAYTEQAAADGTWQHAPASIGNTGFIFMRPTPGAMVYLRGWNEMAPAMLAQNMSEQMAQPELRGTHLAKCHSLCSCQRINYVRTKFRNRDTIGVMRSFAGSTYPEGNCLLASDPLWVPRLEPCHSSVLFVHPICTTSARAAQHKREGMQAAGFWFMDDEEGCPAQPGSVSNVPSCRPLEWRVPGTEAPHYSCPSYGLALVHGVEAPGVAALQKGTLGAEELERSFNSRPC